METINGEWYMKGCAPDDPARLRSAEDLAALVERIVLVYRQTGFPLKPYLRLLGMLSLTSCLSLTFCIFARGFGWAPGWRLLFSTVLGWVTVAACTWQYLLTDGEKAWVRRKLWIFRSKVSRHE